MEENDVRTCGLVKSLLMKDKCPLPCYKTFLCFSDLIGKWKVVLAQAQNHFVTAYGFSCSLLGVVPVLLATVLCKVAKAGAGALRKPQQRARREQKRDRRSPTVSLRECVRSIDAFLCVDSSSSSSSSRDVHTVSGHVGDDVASKRHGVRLAVFRKREIKTKRTLVCRLSRTHFPLRVPSVIQGTVSHKKHQCTECVMHGGGGTMSSGLRSVSF